MIKVLQNDIKLEFINFIKLITLTFINELLNLLHIII